MGVVLPFDPSTRVSEDSAKPLPSAAQVSIESAATAIGSESVAPAQLRRKPASGRPSACASASATGRSPGPGSPSGGGNDGPADQPDLALGVLLVGVPAVIIPRPALKAWSRSRSCRT